MKLTVWQLIKEDFGVPYERDPAIHSKFEIFFNYPGVWAVIWYRIAHFLYIKNFKRLSRIISGVTQMFCGVDIHPAAKIGRKLFIDHATGVVIGETAIVGNDVTIYQQVTLGGVELTQTKRHPTVKDYAVIGAGAKVLGNITIGKNAKVGANSVVIRDVADDCTAVGIPAKTIIKGGAKSPLSHNKLPDIDKELFKYLLKRISILENALINNDKDIINKDEELNHIYQAYLNSMEK
jgi:serine O-acetyltransferase